MPADGGCRLSCNPDSRFYQHCTLFGYDRPFLIAQSFRHQARAYGLSLAVTLLLLLPMMGGWNTTRWRATAEDTACGSSSALNHVCMTLEATPRAPLLSRLAAPWTLAVTRAFASYRRTRIAAPARPPWSSLCAGPPSPCVARISRVSRFYPSAGFLVARYGSAEDIQHVQREGSKTDDRTWATTCYTCLRPLFA